MLLVKSLCKYFDTPKGNLRAVDGINLEVPENHTLGIVGESGSGKSTLGKTIIGLHAKTQGEIYWQGKPMPKHFSRKDFLGISKDMQMIFQDPNSSLNPRMQIWQILEEPCVISKNRDYLKLSKQKRKLFLQEKLEQVGLRPEFYKRFPHEFSGGQQQRVGIARALISKPKLLICDEPVSALDVSVQAQIVTLLKTIQAEYKMSLMFIAHDLAMVNYLCDEVAVMYLGKVVEQGLSKEIFFKPAHPYTKLLLSANPSLSRGENLQERFTIPEIKGESPSPLLVQQGCSFSSRCWLATEQCKEEVPPLAVFDAAEKTDLEKKSSSRKSACFFPAI